MSRPAAVVVGVDGSPAATAAALWAIDEAASRDVPVRLVHAVAATDGSHVTADDLHPAGSILHSAVTAVETSGKPVKVEARVVAGPAAEVLQREADGAVMLCIGSSGLSHGGIGHIGSTALAVAPSTSCPVAIIHADGVKSRDASWTVTEVSDSGTDDVALSRAIQESLLRASPLRIVATWPSRYPDIHDSQAVAGQNRIVKREWERRLAPWQRRHPTLDAQVVAVAGSSLNYFARHQERIDLAILPHERAGEIAELLGPRDAANSQDICFDILICEADGLI